MKLFFVRSLMMRWICYSNIIEETLEKLLHWETFCKKLSHVQMSQLSSCKEDLKLDASEAMIETR